MITPIAIPISGVTITVTPAVVGGDGGDFGVNGDDGFLQFNIQVSVPILGTIFNQDFPDPPISIFPPGGLGGNAVKRNGFVVNGLPDGNYQTTNVKGVVGP